VPRDFFACGENAHGGLNHKRFASLRVYDTIVIGGFAVGLLISGRAGRGYGFFDGGKRV
jgi:hypothetical protein